MVKRKEDFIKTINLEEPKRLPIGELAIDPSHVETLMFPAEIKFSEDKPGSKRKKLIKDNATITIKCYNKLGFSFIVTNVALQAPTSWSAKILPNGSFIDEWGRGMVYDPTCRVWTQTYGTLKSVEDWEKWAENFPDPHAEGRDEEAKIMIKLANKYDMAVAGLVKDPFAILFDSFPIEVFYRIQHEQPEFIKKAVNAYTDYNCKIIRIYNDLGCDFIVSGGDLAEKNNPYLNPKIFNETYFPEMNKQVKTAHKLNMKYVKHSDGNVISLLNGLTSIAKIDGIHSLDPSAGVDIGEVKERYGDKIFLMGNISVDNLALKNTAEIVEETKECIKKAAHGGGLILGSSNTWYTHCKIENCLAMVRTAMEYGNYPIKIS